MKFIITTLFILILSGFCFAQTQTNSFSQKETINNSSEKLENLKQQRIIAFTKRKSLLEKYTEEYSEVRKVDLEIEVIDKQIEELSREIEKTNLSVKEAVNLIVEIQVLNTRLKFCDYSSENEGCKNGKLKSQLSEAFQKVVENPEALNLLFKTQNDETMKLLVEQNQKIIELLEKLVNKK